MKRLIPGLLLALTALTVAADPVTVEVVLFARNTSAKNTNEAWPDRQTIRDFSTEGIPLAHFGWQGCPAGMIDCTVTPPPERLPVTLTRDNATPVEGVTLLGNDALTLGDARQRLAQQGDYRILLHTAWQQELGSKASSPAIRLFGGRNFADRFGDDGYKRIAIDPPAAAATTPALDDLQAQAAAELGQGAPAIGPAPIWELSGTLKAYTNTYLFVEANLQLRQEGDVPRRVATASESATATDSGNGTENSTVVPDTVTQADGVQVLALDDNTVSTNLPTTEPFLFAYPLEQFRRVKIDQIVYFDHPLMGMLIQIRR